MKKPMKKPAKKSMPKKTAFSGRPKEKPSPQKPMPKKPKKRNNPNGEKEKTYYV